MTTQAKEISRHERVKVVTRTTAAAAAEQHESPVWRQGQLVGYECLTHSCMWQLKQSVSFDDNYPISQSKFYNTRDFERK